MTRITYEYPNGGIYILTLVGKSREEGELKSAWIKRITDKCGPKGTVRLGEINIPTDRYFRNCWRKAFDGNIDVDMPLARLQRMEEIRRERDNKLLSLDTEWRIALADDDKTELDKVAVRRQTLRDIPQTTNLEVIQAADDLIALNPAWPE